MAQAKATHRQFIATAVTVVAVCTLAFVAFGAPRTQAAPMPRGGSTSAANVTAPGQPKVGESGPAVLALQKAIVANGFTLVGGLTGNFSIQTVRALKNFQRVVGLPVSGVVDVRTATVLKLITSTPSTKSATKTPTTVSNAKKTIVLAATPVRGATGTHVKLLQYALIVAGVKVQGGVDGVFGSSTALALAAFQKTKKLSPTGILDARTAAALKLSLPKVTTAPTISAPKAQLLTLETLPSFGQKNKQVRILQGALATAGFPVKGGIDGSFGVATRVAIRKFQLSKGLAVTGQLNFATALKLKLVAKPQIMLDVFPVQGVCSYSDTWHDPRPNGRQHLGVDIIAAEGKLLYAVADGTITKIYVDSPDTISGNGVRLAKADGTYFFYGHMSKLAPNIAVGTKVKAGQVIGYVGHTGDTSTDHLHFEVHPFGGDAVNPYPYVKAVDACSTTTPYGTAAA